MKQEAGRSREGKNQASKKFSYICEFVFQSSKQCFISLRSKGHIWKEQLKYFKYEYKKTRNLGELYLLRKIHKRFHDVFGSPVISNWGASINKVSEFLDSQFRPVMQNGLFYKEVQRTFSKRSKVLVTFLKMRC